MMIKARLQVKRKPHFHPEQNGIFFVVVDFRQDTLNVAVGASTTSSVAKQVCTCGMYHDCISFPRTRSRKRLQRWTVRRFRKEVPLTNGVFEKVLR